MKWLEVTSSWSGSFLSVHSRCVTAHDIVEYAKCEATVKVYGPFGEAVKKWGIHDMELAMVDPWCVGYHSEVESPKRRLAKSLIFYKTESECPMENAMLNLWRAFIKEEEIKSIDIWCTCACPLCTVIQVKWLMALFCALIKLGIISKLSSLQEG
ncbi:hypothetical protein GOP47_0011713 [Adiantum capillus-veneris]|uniref:Amine oxidase n=1 Tax=Adiantum capillus-veneris TaxID=13818 RepID=A0A9D4UTT9_ADICA|nr:hypothetical protein GOP47_0011713 [Adiantum capillus-veneris]